MNSLTRRVDRLEEERLPDVEELRRAEELRQTIEDARQRVRAAEPGHKFPDVVGDAPLLPNGNLDLVAALKQARLQN